MPQNIYDDQDFFEGYRRLRDGDSGLNGSVEEPAVIGLLPDLGGRSVLDLGCGFGDFCRFARSRGAVRVVGIDVSQRMIDAAKSRTMEAGIEYQRHAIEEFGIELPAYDCVVSRLAFHYVKNLDSVFRAIYSGLRDRGVFVFAVEHPVCTALCSGWIENDRGDQLHWPVDRYWDEGERQQKWFVEGVIKFHRTVQTYVDLVLKSGFVLTRLLEPHASAEILLRRPHLGTTVRRPALLVIAAQKIPNQAPEPTATAVTPPAAQEPRQP